MHAELPVASFICAFLVLVPLPWHWRAGTVPTISISIWLFLANIINGVNSLIWAGSVSIVVPVWCDITTKIIIGGNVALPSAIFCLCVHLERVSSIRNVRTSRSDKRRRQLIDGLLCSGVPLIFMALHYIVQGHRFDIIEDFGCRPTVYVSIVSVFLIWVPPLFFSVGACILAALAFRNFWNRRITFARHLQDSNSALTTSRYFRLMSMALVQMFWGIAITAFDMSFTMKSGLRPWTGWDDVHAGFSRIALFPTLVIPAKVLTFTYLLWWAVPISSVIFFGFFSFGQDAMKEYRTCIQWVGRNVLRLPDPPAKVNSMASLPSYRRGNNAISLPTLSTSSSKVPDSKSEDSFSSPVPPYCKADETSPGFPPVPYRHSSHSYSPMSPDSDVTPTYSASSTIDVSDTKSRLHDCHSWTDTRSMSNHSSTSCS